MNVINQLYKPMIVFFAVTLACNLFSFVEGSQNVANQTAGANQTLTNLSLLAQISPFPVVELHLISILALAQFMKVPECLSYLATL
jgi:hypothetical protein